MYYIFDGDGTCLFYTHTEVEAKAMLENAPEDIHVYDLSIMFIPKDTPHSSEFYWY